MRQPTDLRLLVPAVVAWAVAAATLGLTPSAHLIVAGGLELLAALLFGIPRARRRLRHGGVLWPLALTVLLVAGLQVAAAAHGILRARGGVEELAADRAAITAVAVVTSDPIVLQGRGDRPVVLREATLLLVDARGLRRSTGAPVLLTGSPAIARPAWRSTVLVRGRLGSTDRADDRVATLAVSSDPHFSHRRARSRQRRNGCAPACAPRSTGRLPTPVASCRVWSSATPAAPHPTSPPRCVRPV